LSSQAPLLPILLPYTPPHLKFSKIPYLSHTHNLLIPTIIPETPALLKLLCHESTLCPRLWVVLWFKEPSLGILALFLHFLCNCSWNWVLSCLQPENCLVIYIPHYHRWLSKHVFAVMAEKFELSNRHTRMDWLQIPMPNTTLG
jgi:hypothetical protein